MMITEKEIDEIVKDCKFALDALAMYDARYIGNVPEKKARKLFPELFRGHNHKYKFSGVSK